MDLIEFFQIGMDRSILSPWAACGSVRLNLGAGAKQMPPGVVSIGLPEWNAETMPIPYPDASVDEVWALHFMEHISNVSFVLQECQRVIRSGGTMNIVVPYGTCHMAVQDPDHKRYFNEDSWRHLFANPYYDTAYGKGQWELEVRTNVIMGIKGENLALLTQLIKQ